MLQPADGEVAAAADYELSKTGLLTYDDTSEIASGAHSLTEMANELRVSLDAFEVDETGLAGSGGGYGLDTGLGGGAPASTDD